MNKKSQLQQVGWYFLSLKLGNKCHPKVRSFAPNLSNKKAISSFWFWTIFIVILIVIGVVIYLISSANIMDSPIVDTSLEMPPLP